MGDPVGGEATHRKPRSSFAACPARASAAASRHAGMFACTICVSGALPMMPGSRRGAGSRGVIAGNSAPWFTAKNAPANNALHQTSVESVRYGEVKAPAPRRSDLLSEQSVKIPDTLWTMPRAAPEELFLIAALQHPSWANCRGLRQHAQNRPRPDRDSRRLIATCVAPTTPPEARRFSWARRKSRSQPSRPDHAHRHRTA